MSSTKTPVGPAVFRRAAFAFALAAALFAASPGANAQCTVTSSPVNFEPNPPGPAGPRPVTLSPINMNNVALYQNGAGGPWQLLMEETFGYSVLGLTNPMSPSILRWDYLPFDANRVTINGDGQSYVGTIAASPDGQRAALSLNGPGTPPWHTVVGSPDGNAGFKLWGDAPPENSSGTVIQQAGSRYVMYSPVFGGVYATDITTLPNGFGASNMTSEVSPWPGGSKPTLAGGYLVYMASDSTIEIVDISNPGQAGSITSGMPRTSIGPATFAGRSIANVKAAVDPSNPKMLWILAELSAAAGENSPSYGLVSMTEDGAGNFSAPVSAGPLFRVPAQAGETFIPAGNASALASINGTVHALMWAVRRSPYQAVLYASTTFSWPVVTQNNIVASGFGVSNAMGVLPGAGSTVYAYIANASNAWVLPLTCQAANAKATATLSAVNTSSGGTAVNDGDAVPYGETLTFTPQVLPNPISGQTSDLTGFRWNIDFDFHVGNLTVEDNGAAASPRFKNPDNDQFTAGLQYPPTTVTLVGPCDPRSGGGVPQTGAGCWTSVTGNGNQTASGSPDFAGSEAAGALTPLVFGFEANNQNGSNGPRLFTVKWKRPTISLATTQILSGEALTVPLTDPIQIAQFGHPQSGGANVWKWYFGSASNSLVQVSCATNSCLPAGTDASPGLHYYWVTAPYAQIGYSTPDYAGAALGTYTVTSFAPSFSINGSTTSLTVGVGQTLTASNTSRRGATTTGGGGYFYCLIPSTQAACNANDWQLWSSMSDPAGASTGLPATAATIPNPGAGSWVLRLKVNYQNPSGTAYWPDASGTAGMPITVTTSLAVTATVNPNPAASGTTVLFSCSASGGSGNYNYQWSGQFGNVSQTQTYSTRVTNTGASNSTVSLDCTATDAVTFATGTGTATVTVQPAPAAPLFASASVAPNPVTIGNPATFSCSGTGGTGAYTYQWTDAQFHTLSQTQSFVYTPTSLTPITLSCTVTDGANKTAISSATLSVIPPPGPTCPAVDFAVYNGATRLVSEQTQFGAIPMQASAGDVLSFSVIQGTPPTVTWDFGDNTLQPTGPPSQPVYHTYTSAGLYTATLKPLCADNATFGSGTSYQIQISGPSGNFTPRYDDSSPFVATNVTGGKAVRFTAAEASADSYDWDFGDATAHGTGQSAVHVFAPGTFTVKLSVVKGTATASSTLALTVVAPPEPPKWVVPGMAYVSSSGAQWTSDVTFFNPDPTLHQHLQVAFLDARNLVSDGASLAFVPTTPLDIAPLSSMSFPNVLSVLAQPLGAYGALLVKGTAGPQPPVITARTFNNAGAQGTFGLSVPTAAASGGGISAQASPAASVLVGLRQNDAARTNLGLVNLNNDWPTVRLDFSEGLSAAPLGSMTLTMNPYQSLQIDRILQQIPPADPTRTSDLYTVKVSVLDQAGHTYAVYPYATVIDALSTDPVVVTPTAAPSNTYRLPGIIRLTGANGEKWRSRVTVSNPSAGGRKVHLAFTVVGCTATGCSNPLTFQGDVNFAAGQTQSWDDFVSVWLKYTSSGIVVADDATSYMNSFLDVSPSIGDTNADPLVVLGETYNATPTGHVGLQIPGYTPADGASAAGAYKRLVLTGLASTAAFRTNLALLAVAGTPARWANVHVYSPQGTNLRNIPVFVDATGFAQVSNATLFGGLPGDLSRLSVVIDNVDAGLTVGAYATIIDNTSGDATFVKATPEP